MIRTNRRIRDLFTAIAALALVGIMLALLVSPAQAAGPTVPTELRATALWAGIIDVQWSAVSEADSYQLQLWSDAASRWKDLPTDGVEVAYYGAGAIVRGLPESSTSWYRVRAVNSHGASGWSEFLIAAETDGPTAWSDVPEPTNVAATGAPAISGDLQVDGTLTVDTSGMADANGLERVEFRYQWLANDGGTYSEIDGATEPAYILTRKEAGKTVRVRVSFTDRHGFAESATSAATEPVPIPEIRGAKGAPLISGRPWVHGTLTADTSGIVDADGLENVAYSYQWLSSRDTEIEGAASSTYSLQTADQGKTIRVRVSFTDDAGNDESLTSAATDTVAVRANSPATGLPTIRGTAQVGQTLTVDTSDIADPDGLGSATFSYQWIRNYGTNDYAYISGATGPTYTLVSHDAGKTIQVLVSFTDGADNEETLTSTPTETVDFAVQSRTVNTPATGQPTIVGTPRVGERLTVDLSSIADEDGLENAEYGFVWFGDYSTERQGGRLLADTAQTTLPVPEFFEFEVSWLAAGTAISVQVYFTDDAGNYERLASEPTEVVPGPLKGFSLMDTTDQSVVATLTYDSEVILDDPANGSYGARVDLAADAQVGSVRLDFSYGQYVRTDNSAPYSLYGEDANGLLGEGLPAGTYYLSATAFSESDQGGDPLQILVVRFTVAEPNSPSTGAPTIVGTPQVGQTLTADTSGIADADGLENVAYSYQWLSSRDTEIEGATSSTYSLQTADEGKTIRVRVSFTDDAGNEETLTSAATATVSTTVPGIPRSVAAEPAATGRLEVTWQAPESDGGSEVTGYKVQWKLVSGSWDTPADVSEATATTTTHTISGLELDVDYVVRVIATNAIGGSSPSDQITVTAVALTSQQQAATQNNPATGQPSIGGTAQVGETLLADTSSIADSDGLTNVAFSYQWIRNDSSTDTDIQNATGSTYTLVSDDAGKFIKVEVSFTDDEGNKETLTSSATTAVEAQANAEPPSYITVAVTKRTSDPNNIVTNFTISWFDADDCTTDYNAYLNIAAGNRPGQETPGSQHHLGSVASDGAQIANGLSGIQGPMEGFNVELYCGSTESGRLVSRVRIPRGPGARPFTGTYSSEPPLSALSVSHGTLTPTFNSHTFDYTASDIANADTRITITATPKEGYAVDFFEWSGGPVIHGVAYSPGPGRIITGLSDDCFYGVGDHFGQLPELADADPDTPGFQVDVYDGENYIHIRVYPTAFCAGGEGYGLEMTRAEGSVSLIRPNRPATGRVSIDPDLGRLAEPTSPWPGLDLRTDTDHSNFRDRDGLTNPTYSYQWLADDAEMAGETSTGYRVKLADLGKTLKVRVSFTDDRGTEETLTSTSTKVVKLRNYRPTGEPIIRGTLEVGQTLTAEISGISDPNGMTNATFSYRWKYTTYYGSASTDSEYTLVSRDEGTSLTWLEVTYTDDDGHEERLYTERQGLVAPSPTKATGAPVITGVAQVGETLTVDTSGIADSDGLANVSYSYQWFSNDGTMIRSHWRNTASTYTLVDADKGRTIQVHVYFTDDAGFEEKLTSAATVTVTATTPGAPRSVDVEPAGTGRLSLSWQEPASNGGSEISGYTVEWKKAADSWDTDEDVSKATAMGTTYTITGLELDVEYTVRVIATNTVGDGPASDEVAATPAAQTSQQQAAIQNTPATGQPTISGTAQVGETLTVDTSGIADADGVTNASYGGTWYANDTEGRYATGQGGYVLGGKAPGYDLSYTVSRGAVGKTVKIEVYFTDDAGNREWLASAKTGVVTATTPAAPENVTASLTASGDLVLSWEVPTWDPMSEFFGEQTWGDGGSAITEYVVQWKEASSSWDTEADVSEATVTGTTHTIRDLTSGTEYTARVIAVNSVGRGSPSDEASVTTNTPATGTPTISGTAQVGQTLTASTSGISDTDGLTNVTYSYQWLTSRDTEIEGATSSTYSLQTADEGKTIRVRVSFTDDAGNAETLTSAATAEVEVPLTAELQNVPESHNGEDAFTFRILFSEPVTVGYQALKEDSFEISDGTITRARRVNGRDDLRQFTVRPSSDLDVAIVLPADRPCDDEGAICTSDGKRLSNRLALTVPGPAPANALATGAPTINGTAQVGQTLTATTSNIADSDGLVNAAYGYQWVRNDGGTDAEIQDATGSTYTLDAADEGKTVKVRVSFTDDAGNDESLTSAATDTVAVRANSPATGLPTIRGTAQVDETLTAETSAIADEDGLSNVAYNYQWLADDTDIARATGSSYTLADADEGKTVKVRVSFTDDGGNQESLTSAPTAMVSTPLTAGFQWMPGSHNGSDEFTIFIQFSEEIASSYVTLRDHALTVTGGEVVSADVFGYSDLWALGIDPDGNGDVTIALPITTDCSATGAVCTGGGKKLSNHIEHTVSGPVHANSVATGIPTITGTAQVGETLTAGTSGISDEDGLTNATFSYQWIRNDGGVDTEIQGATDSTYTLDHADAGKTVKVRVSFTDDAGNDESLISTATTEVAAKPNSPATGVPAVSGTTQVGETLTADTSNIADSDGLVNATYAYQWLADDTDIAGATGSSYTLADADEGKAIKVEVSFTDNAGNAEAQTSAVTAAIADLPPEPLTAVIENGASSHDGTTVFTFELRFSEELELSYVTLRDHAFTVEGGKVKKAQRMDKSSNIHWRITVEPDSSATVTLVLPVTTDCNAAGAICTEDGRMLSNRTEITVAGPSG